MPYQTIHNVIIEPIGREGCLPFYDDVERIYIAYRQCYSENPWKKPEISEARRDELKDLFNKSQGDDSRSVVVVPDDIADKVYLYWHMCDFIRRHMHHESPLEHGSATFMVTGLHRASSHQWVRSRIAAHSQQSQRYVRQDDPTLVLPMPINNNPKARKIVTDYLDQLPGVLAALQEVAKEDPKITQDDIRIILPNATATSIVTTCNFREWIHILQERRCSRASYDYRYMANLIYNYLHHHIPFIFDNLTPKCEALGYCPEEKGCGRKPMKKTVFDCWERVHKEASLARHD